MTIFALEVSRRPWAGTAALAFAAERDRWALWIPVAMAAGIAVYFSLDREPPTWAAALAMAAAAAAAAAAVRLRHRAAGLAAAIAAAAMATGFAAAQVRTVLVAAPVIERELGPVSVTGRIAAVERRPSDRRLTLADLEIAGLAPEAAPETVRLVVRARNGDVKPGDRVRLRAVLLPPSPPVAPGAFDFARQAWFQSLGGVGYAVSAPEVIVVAAPGAWAAGLDSLRHAISVRITSALAGQQGAVAAALMTGDRGGIDDDAWASLRDSGLAHLLAISGLHVGLVAGILFAILRGSLAAWESLALRFPIKKWAAAAGMAGALGYLGLTGGTIPTQRAVLMLGFVLLAVMLDRRPISMRLVAWAAAAVLLVAPDSLLGPSFQMSFAAVVALVAAYEVLRAPFSRWRRGGNPRHRRLLLYAAGIVVTTVVAGLATAPFALYHFNRVAAYSLAANVLAVPVTALWIMPWAMLAYGLMPLGLEGLALAPMGWGISFVLGVADAVASWPGAAYTLPMLPMAGLTLVALGGLWLCLWRRRWRLAGLPMILLGLATTGSVPPPDVLVSDDGTYFAVRRSDGGLWATSIRSNYTVDSWLRRDGLDLAGRWPKPGTGTTDGLLRCDSTGCVYQAGARTVALAETEDALAEDCREADAVVAVVAVFLPCAADVVVDRLDLWRRGAHAVWITPAGIRVESVSDRRGSRPWVLPRHRGPE